MIIADTKAVISGGASGLGEATARHFRAQGAAVTLLDQNAERGTEVAKEIGAHFIKTDVTSESSVETAIAEAQDIMGGLTAAVNCAGVAWAAKTVGKNGPHPFDLFKSVLDINLVGTFNVARLAAAAMAENTPDAGGERGVIVNTASVAAFEGQKGQIAYSASKGGVAGMTTPMARDLASLGIRVMAIAPGTFLTPMLEGLGEEIIDGLAKDVLCPQRLGDPNEYARLVEFIVSCGYLNAEVIRIDGGLRMR